MVFTVGPLTADALNNPRYARVASDVSTTSTSFLDVTGLAFTVVSGGEYFLDGAIFYYGTDGVDLQLSWSGPAMSALSWGLGAVPVSGTGTSGSIERVSRESLGDGNAIKANTETDAAMYATVGGMFRPSASGTLQMRFAQNTSSAFSLIVKRGSWLRLYRYA